MKKLNNLKIIIKIKESKKKKWERKGYSYSNEKKLSK